ncbi:3-hydroxyacyl-CoA dehydrogenase [Pararhodonellum marinum]|uniref:3-hydroxyacyl-CoA dehydrogenase n=1 Tax=Pararhodonellum marinum TaxID=2755358 RepID=UPI00293BEBE9|nr:3-hydroxyacyl-CoA dehydrogenase [Pararhodonellum marinum]
MMEIKKVGIVGAGTLGSRIGLQAALSGYKVVVYDLNQEALDQAQKVIEKILHVLNKAGVIHEAQAKAALERIAFTLSLDKAVDDVDLISESVTEDIGIKAKVWAALGKASPAKTIFTTNTSFLLPSLFAADTGRPDKFCALHFHDVFYAKIVDIMPHEGTDPALIPLLEDFGRKLNQVPVIIKKENPGYLFNTMLMALLGAAGKLVTKEIGSIEDIDKSWMVNFHMPMGPFGIIDNIGLDTAWHVTKSMKDPASQRFANFLRSYMDQGKLGEKTGEGFYRYPNPAYKEPGFLK